MKNIYIFKFLFFVFIGSFITIKPKKYNHNKCYAKNYDHDKYNEYWKVAAWVLFLGGFIGLLILQSKYEKIRKDYESLIISIMIDSKMTKKEAIYEAARIIINSPLYNDDEKKYIKNRFESDVKMAIQEERTAHLVHSQSHIDRALDNFFGN
jgi:hypothetical protein